MCVIRQTPHLIQWVVVAWLHMSMLSANLSEVTRRNGGGGGGGGEVIKTEEKVSNLCHVAIYNNYGEY